MKKSRLIVVITLIAILAMASVPSWAQEPAISDVVVTKYNNTVYVYFTLKDCYSREVEQVIKSGIPTTFVFEVAIIKLRPLWFNEPIIRKTIKHTIKFDSLTEEYIVSKAEDGGKPTIIKDFEMAKNAMSRVVLFPVVSLDFLENGSTYRLEMRGKFEKVKVPDSVKYVLFFTNLWYFETDWYREEFTY